MRPIDGIQKVMTRAFFLFSPKLGREILEKVSRKSPFDSLERENTVPQTDTGEQVEYTKANELPTLKELGKLVQ